RNRPRHGMSAVAMLYPAQGVGLIAAFEPLHLALAQLQQTGGFAYAQPPACCILNHFHSLELFLTHRHHPYRVTKSRCSYGVTLSWSIYTTKATGLPTCFPLSKIDGFAHWLGFHFLPDALISGRSYENCFPRTGNQSVGGAICA